LIVHDCWPIAIGGGHVLSVSSRAATAAVSALFQYRGRFFKGLVIAQRQLDSQSDESGGKPLFLSNL
jgi:hypothetical protein